jgi:hypothetical protein
MPINKRGAFNMKASALEVNLDNPRVRDRVNKIMNLEPLDDGTKLTARNIEDDEVINPGKLSGYDLHVFKQDEPSVFWAVFSFDTPIAWAIEGTDGLPMRFITSVPITTTTERHRDVVRRAWLAISGTGESSRS